MIHKDTIEMARMINKYKDKQELERLRKTYNELINARINLI